MDRRRTTRSRRPRRFDFVELRVHGVSGTPPEELLDTSELVQVRGDDTAGFFRPRPRSHHGGDDGVEAYSWGGLTSRSWTRALWVPLAPFALLNVAGWMLPAEPTDRGRWAHHLAGAAVRVLALHVTLMAVLWVGAITMELVAFQCGGSPPCRTAVSWVGTVFGDWAVGAPGRRLVLGAVGPVLFVFGLWMVGRVSRARYEALFDEHDPDSEHQDGFADPTFWDRRRRLGRLALVHVAAALALTAHQLSSSVGWLQGVAAPAAATAVAWSSCALLGVTVVAVAGADVSASGAGRRGLRFALRPGFGEVMTSVSAVVLLAAAVIAWWWPGTDPAQLATGGFALPAYGRNVARATVIAVAVGALLVVALWRHPERCRRIPSPLGDGEIPVAFAGWGPAFTSLLGYGTAGVLLLSLGSWSARLLGGRPVVDYPVTYDAAAVITFWGVLLMTLVAAGWAWWRAHNLIDSLGDDDRRPFCRDDFRSPLPSEARRAGATWEATRAAWVRSIERTWVLRLVVTHFDTVLIVIISVLAVGLVPISVAPFFEVPAADTIIGWTPTWMVTFAVWALSVGVPVGMFLLVRRSFSSSATRRRVGVLWDVLTFWPRWYHPLAPPSYTARAVPELQTRLDVLSGETTAVAVSAHSQGSVLALAALDGLAAQQRRRGQHPARPIEHIALLTHGSPITRLYLRVFAAHLRGPITRVAGTLCNDGPGANRWINLYRASDPIGGAIAGEHGPLDPRSLATGPPDVLDEPLIVNPLADPDLSSHLTADGPPLPSRGDPYPRPCGHSQYADSLEYRSAIDALRAASARGHGVSTRRSGPRGPAGGHSTTQRPADAAEVARTT